MNAYNFTDAVRRVLQAARQEAIALDHEYVGTEHILLGLLREDDGVPASVFHALHADPSSLRQSLLDTLGRGTPGKRIDPDLPYTSRAKKVLEEAMAEARDLRHAYIGTEHLLLGLLRERKGLAAQVLVGHGTTETIVRRETIRILQSEPTAGKSGPLGAGEPPPGAIPSSFLIIIEDSAGQQGMRRFTDVQDAIGYLNQWRGRS